MDFFTTEQYLNTIPEDFHIPLLHYLNLPHGCFLDDSRSLFHGGAATYELDDEMRSLVLKERAVQGGEYTDVASLSRLHEAAPELLPEILCRLRDVARYGNHLHEVWGGADSKRAFFDLVQSAEKYIHISTYILGGRVGCELAEILAEKKRHGVEVRLLFAASGLVISGSPSGTGMVNRLTALRSFMVNDLYRRKKLLKKLSEGGVPWLDSSPIGCHWRRHAMKKKGIRSASHYYDWLEVNAFPQSWIVEQQLIDAECGVGFVNVDHRKFIIVDGKKAFIGSQNISDSYFYDNELDDDHRKNHRSWQWHDGSFILSGGAVHTLSDLFAMRWWLSGGDRFDYQSYFYKPAPSREGNASVAIVPTIPGTVRAPLKKNLKGFLKTLFGGRCMLQIEGRNPVRERLLRLPEIARESVFAEHCYPSDTEVLIRWSEMVSDGKMLRLIVPRHYDVHFLGMECDSNLPRLVETGADVLAYHRAILHNKVIVVDEYYVIAGSYNLNLRSSRADMECTFFIQDGNLGKCVCARMEQDLIYCEKVVPSIGMKLRSHFSVPVIDAILRYFVY